MRSPNTKANISSRPHDRPRRDRTDRCTLSGAWSDGSAPTAARAGVRSVARYLRHGGSSARRFLAALVLDESTVNLARALVPRWVEDPPSNDRDEGYNDHRREIESRLGGGNAHGWLTRRGKHSHGASLVIA
jgi:hypothetical protein